MYTWSLLLTSINTKEYSKIYKKKTIIQRIGHLLSDAIEKRFQSFMEDGKRLEVCIHGRFS